ncbi:hypothetical protein ACG2LH_10145 [Zhouia sp. PK063]|uniref:hypothetical protein n=1 Tax=Zhouia sp. PK063 TaxID=3373602 RepID=UPI00379F5357
MKKNYAVVLFLLLVSIAFSQEKFDKVFMLDSEVRVGTVKAVNPETVMFSFKGETLEYDIAKSKIEKIEFASGRTQVFNATLPSNTEMPISVIPEAERKNKLAVIPFTMLSNEPALTSDEKAEQLQREALGSFQEFTKGIQIQDALQTNALLAKNNINKETIKALLPKDVAAILGVEYVVYGSADITFKGTSTSASSSSTYKEKKKEGEKETKTTGNEYGSSNSYTAAEYNTVIALNIYSDKGDSVYNVQRTGFGSSLDKYVYTLSYLIKRCPWGTKKK